MGVGLELAIQPPRCPPLGARVCSEKWKVDHEIRNRARIVALLFMSGAHESSTPQLLLRVAGEFNVSGRRVWMRKEIRRYSKCGELFSWFYLVYALP